MKYLKYVVVILFLFILGCDSSPLKSDLEQKMNRAYKTDFDYIDRIELKDHNNKEHIIIDDLAKISNVINYLTDVKVIGDPELDDNPQGEISILTSEQGKDYNTKQTSAVLDILTVTESSSIIRYQSNFYEIPVNIFKVLKEEP
ncbi:hypothetical protein [Paenibacillus agilis]|uniref:Uncharacterized protein n=1 Tax=Paenibacillus agilis TaxID=3020863 RepID=A0A559IW22_9BACL|nr:hypothetical protein [Paenibacillus agilis]TVX91838.1 hypothetical protein FPZ44_01435 [Paenibacillus agilis]